ncbi:MAG TPA: C2H2-type zinc finger protein [Gaiellaceae bacterium]|jgi:hypothetical protein
MARARRGSKTSSSPSGQSSGTGEFKCPECGRTFARPAALGAHRRRAHGVAGATSRTRKKTGSRSGRTTATRRSTATRARSSAASRQVDRDALLQALFPNGVPAREAVIRAANDWLDQAEQLARMS